jgi:glycerol kinase
LKVNMVKYYLGIDQGTSGTTALLLDSNLNILAQETAGHSQIYPEPGWVEHDSFEILEAVKNTASAVLRKTHIDASELSAIGLDHQGETCTVWEKNTGNPVYNAIVWQDRRTSGYAETIKEKYGEMIHQKTGVYPDAYFSATKLKWILDNVAGAREKAEKGELLCGTLDSFLIYKLTGGAAFITDAGTAARTMLMNLVTGEWDEELLNIFTVPRKTLPAIRDSSDLYACTKPEEFFGASVPITSCTTDANAAAFGQGCIYTGDIKATYGTGVFISLNTGDHPRYSQNGLLTLCLFQLGGKRTYELEAGVYISGAALSWLRDNLGFIKSSAESENMALSVNDTGGVYFVPAFSGLAAPYWDQYARGMIIGITGGTSKEHIVRAALESTAFQVFENIETMKKDSGLSLTTIKADGGPTDNDFLMQFQADLLGLPLEIPEIREMSAYGAALLAASAFGDISPPEVPARWKLKKRYEPKMSGTERDDRIGLWKCAVERCRSWAS